MTSAPAASPTRAYRRLGVEERRAQLLGAALTLFAHRAPDDVSIDEVAAAASGVPTVKYKLMAFAIGASTSGFAGVLSTAKITAITPDNFPLTLSIFVLAYVIFGGMGSLVGVIVGAALMTFLPAFLQGPPSWFNSGHPVVDPKDIPMWIGAVLLAMMIFRPQGLIPSKRRAQELSQAEAGVGEADAMTGVAEGVAQ